MTAHRRAVLAGLGLWLVAAAVGWALFRVGGGTEARGLVRWGLWGAALAVVVASGLLLMRSARTVVRADGPAEASIAVGVGWGVASAAGWFFDVSVGGPFTGMVLALGSGSGRSERPWVRIAMTLAAGLVGLALGVRLLGGRGSMLALVTALAIGLPAVLLANRVLLGGSGWLTLVWSTAIWGFAWVGSWALTSSAPVARLLGGESLPAEVILACLVGGLLTALAGKQALKPALLWGVAGLAAVTLGALLNIAIRSAGFDPGPGGTWLDVGYTIGLALAIPFAFDSTSDRGSKAAG